MPVTAPPGAPPSLQALSAGSGAVQPDATEPAPLGARGAAASALGPPVVLRTAGPARRPSAPLVGGLRPSAHLGHPGVIPRSSAPEPDAARADEIGSPSAALAALARVDPFGGPFGDTAPGPGTGFIAPGEPPWSAPFAGRPAGFAPQSQPGFASQSQPGAGFSAMPAVSRSLGAGDDAQADDGPGLTWTNPWAPRGASETAERPGSGPSPRTTDVGLRSAQPIVSRAPSGPFVPRPRGLRVAPAIQRRVTQSGSQSEDAQAERAPASEPLDGWGTGRNAPAVARLADTAAPPVNLAPLQRAEDATSVAPTAGADPASGVAGGTSGAPGSPAAEKELDDLARRLYDRIGLRLRRELLVERERSGALVDRGF